jgi:hypothetical protein
LSASSESGQNITIIKIVTLVGQFCRISVNHKMELRGLMGCGSWQEEERI